MVSPPREQDGLTMTIGATKSARWAAAVFLAAGAALATTPAPAQSLLGAIIDALGGRPSYRAPPAYAPPAYYADPGRRDPLGAFTEPPPGWAGPQGGGRPAAYCVRLCDGRYFPVQQAELCSTMCPASRTKVFFGGGKIDYAAAHDGTRYGDLANAFVYRDRVLDGCTCNGKDAFGLAPVDVASDPTLRAGDIVAAPNGLLAYTPGRSRRGAATANFTPVDPARLSRDLQARLSAIEIAKPR
jgi:hypothetical protein